MISPDISPALNDQVPSPLSVPLLRYAPSGMPLRISVSTDSVVDGSINACICNSTSLSSVPMTSVVSSVGASMTGVTVTPNVDVTVAESPPSVSVAVALTSRLKSP